MTDFNLDAHRDVTVTFEGKKYALKVPQLSNASAFTQIFEEFEKIKTDDVNDVGGFKQMQGLLKKLFVKPPPDEALGKMNTVQVAQLLQYIQRVISGDMDGTDAKKK